MKTAAPSTFEESGLKRAIVISISTHAAIILILAFKSVVMPTAPKVYLPSLRVDLVALPGHKINETPILAPPVTAPEKTVKPKSLPKDSEIKVKEAPDKADVSLTKKQKKSNEKLKNALAKIRALEKINAAEAKDSAEPIKGNVISKGSAISGEAKASLETTYYDVVLEKVRGNWELPKWLLEQNFSATVLIFLDRNGKITSFEFVKNSDNDQFDQEVRRAVQSSAPFPAPPTAILPDLASQGITLGFPL